MFCLVASTINPHDDLLVNSVRPNVIVCVSRVASAISLVESCDKSCVFGGVLLSSRQHVVHEHRYDLDAALLTRGSAIRYPRGM
jgi:hypothetical protein